MNFFFITIKELNQFLFAENSLKCFFNCPKMFKSRTRLSYHMRKFHKFSLANNDYCGEQSKDNQEENPKKAKIPRKTRSKGVKCKDCFKKFSDRISLHEHYRLVHPDERRFHCEKCPASFAIKGNLTKHCYTHAGLLKIENEFNENDKAHDIRDNKDKSH